MDHERIQRCLERGLSILVGTVDGRGMPSCCRGVALTSSDGLEHATVFVPIATSRDVIANLATTKRVAVVAVQPIDNCSTQLKGTASTARLATDAEVRAVRANLDAFKEAIDIIGVPRRVSERMSFWPAFAIDMRVDEIYEQTPGPKAGTRLR